MRENINRIIRVAKGLGPLCDEVVFVGGSIAALYTNGESDIRPTLDVDCISEFSSYTNYKDFEKKVRLQGFVNDIESGIICRWKFGDDTVDIMPIDEDILGFSNIWYKEGFKNRITIKIKNDIKIKILPILYYIATKIEALIGRGGPDWRLSHDFEDIVSLLNANEEIVNLFEKESNEKLKIYISDWSAEVLKRSNLREEIECCLPYGDEDRAEIIISILKNFQKT